MPSADKVIEYISSHPHVQKIIQHDPIGAEEYAMRHGVGEGAAAAGLGHYMKEHHLSARDVELAIAHDYVTENGPRPSCPQGNCSNSLGSHDVIGATFYIACNGMLAFAAFFMVQTTVVRSEWKTSTSVAGLVCLVAWYNYTFMRAQWTATQQSPTVYRYTDWLITVPLQIAEFYFILKAAGPVSSGLGLRLLTSSVLMILFGWLAEIDVMAKLVGFTLGMACWLYILYEVMAGSAAECATRITSSSAKQAFGTLKTIVSLGWSIYPIGFAIAYLCKFDQPAGNQSILAEGALNVIYNLADFINKGAFGLCVWSAAVSAGRDNEKPLL